VVISSHNKCQPSLSLIQSSSPVPCTHPITLHAMSPRRRSNMATGRRDCGTGVSPRTATVRATEPPLAVALPQLAWASAGSLQPGSMRGEGGPCFGLLWHEAWCGGLGEARRVDGLTGGRGGRERASEVRGAGERADKCGDR
jgi:hypothetical protein